MRYSLSLLVCLLLFTSSYAQDLAYGFKAGLNFSTLTGETETNETTSYTSGFHIGLLVDLGFTDNLGIRGELLYTQKGREMMYDGESYFVFSPFDLRIPTRGQRTINLTVSNSYAQLPIMAYAKFGRIEFMAGGYASLRIGSSGNGAMTYRSGSLPEELDFDLFHLYGQDEAGTFGSQGGIRQIFINGNRVEVPSELGAYYELSAGPDKGLYKINDLGVVGGVSFYLGRALFFNVRAEYGLMDITNNNVDITLESLGSNNQLLTRTDNDRNMCIHTALGFRF